MADGTDLMNLHHIAFNLGKTVEELDDLPVSGYYRWVVYLRKRERALNG